MYIINIKHLVLGNYQKERHQKREQAYTLVEYQASVRNRKFNIIEL